MTHMDPTTAPSGLAADAGLLPTPTAADMSLGTLFLGADPIVQGVMILLALASIGCWAVIFDKVLRLRRLSQEVGGFEASLDSDPASTGVSADIHAAGRRAAAKRDADETAGEARARCEQAMRRVMTARLRGLERGLPFLATVGSTAPFVGLFGTVWGIMNSFTAIARSHDASLAVVAPGIAEALFATALGLAAAIPAIVGYNKLTSAFGHRAQRLSGAIAELAAQLTRRNTGSVGYREAAE
jgi:biopolymer transport protein ExbB/TolQ